MTDTSVRFGLLCSMFQAMAQDRSAAKKRKRFRTFLDRVYTGREYFSAVRLIVPSLDRERGSYGLKESAMATAIVEALAISKDSEDALRLINWRKGGARTGGNAGNFALVAVDILQRRQGLASGGLTIAEVNDALDQLSSRDGRGEKAAVLSDLIKKTNTVEMKWILMIILKDLKLGISEKSIFHEFHPDAEDLFNVTCDLKLVCEKLKDKDQRHKRQDIEVGKAVRPQLAMRISDASSVWKKFHGKKMVAECKFDGDRIQIHKNGKELHFFSRNFLDHSEYLRGMSDVILQNILADRCILDGEMLVWDTTTNRFAEFGSNQEIAKAAMQGLQGDRQLCYVAFDILYAGDTSVIHQSLVERHKLLQKVVKPLNGRLEILVPNGGLNNILPLAQPRWSIIINCVEDIEKFFKETVENRDEGIVLKDLSSNWEPGDRSGKWLKLKPDYVHAGADLDVLIIGGYFGSGRHGGEVAQFLVGLAECSNSSSYPKRFLSFCRVGTGLSDEDLDILITRLKPYFRKNENPKRSPHFYEVTNNSKERPDVWVESPDKSVILSISSDIRTIKSEVFAAPYCLRFPRIQRVRYDKPWHECLDVESFRELVQSSNGTTQRKVNPGALQLFNTNPQKLAKKREKRGISVIAAQSIQPDIAAAKKTSVFANMMFYFVNVPSAHSVDYFHQLVAENGGSFSLNLNDAVTHCIAAEKRGIKYQAAMRRGDVIHYSWVLDCCNHRKLEHIKPKHFLFFADSSKMKHREEIDAFSDYYYIDVDLEDIKQIFSNIVKTENSKMIEHYKKKYLPGRRMGMFHGCIIYLHEMSLRNDDFKIISELSMRRMKLEITMHGGKICANIEPETTHILVYAAHGFRDFEEIHESIPTSQRHHLRRKKLYVLTHNWLEDSLEKSDMLPESSYNLKPGFFEELEEKDNVTIPAIKCEMEDQNSPASGKRKRGRRAAVKATAIKPPLRPARRTRSKVAKRSVKLDTNETQSDSSMETAPSIQLKNENQLSSTGETANRTLDDRRIKEEEAEEDQIAVDLKRRRDEQSDPLKTSGGDKLEFMTDPIHAMLLDMIPSLTQIQKRREDGGPSSIAEEKKAQQEPDGDQNRAKKKVSYKDVAGELLKDW